MLHQPLLLRRVRLLFVQHLIAGGHNVQRQPRLVLTGAGDRHPAARLRLRALPAVSSSPQTGDLVFIQPGLHRLGAVGRTDQRPQARLSTGGEHLVEVLLNPLVHLQPAGSQRRQLHGKVLRQRIPGIDQQQLPVRLLTCGRLRLLRRRQGFRRFRHRLRFRRRLWRSGLHQPKGARLRNHQRQHQQQRGGMSCDLHTSCPFRSI